MIRKLQALTGVMVVGIAGWGFSHRARSAERSTEVPDVEAAQETLDRIAADEEDAPVEDAAYCGTRSFTPTPWRAGSALAFDERRGVVAAADADRGLVHLFTPDLKPLRSVAVGDQPSQLVLNRDGSLVVAVRGAGDVVRIDRDGRTSRVHLGGEPWGIARSDDGASVFVTCTTTNEVVALDSSSLEIQWRTSVDHAPRAIATTPSGKLVVGYLRDDALTTLDAASGVAEAPLALPVERQRKAAHADVLASVGERLLVFHDETNTGVDAQAIPSGGYGGAQTQPIMAAVSTFQSNSLSPIFGATCSSDSAGNPEAELTAAAHLVLGGFITNSQLFRPNQIFRPAMNRADINDVPLGDLGLGELPNPGLLPQSSAAVALPALGVVAIASRGTNSIQFRRLHDFAPIGENLNAGDGPVALAASASGSTLYVLTAFSRQVHAIDLEHGFPKQSSGPTASLGPSGLDLEVESGRQLFHLVDARISGVGLACASCHPDGREDGLVWSIEGGRRQTPSLAGRLADTAPYNWEGTQTSLEANIAQTIHRLGGSGDKETTALLKPLAAYLLSLKAPENPHSHVAPEQRKLVARGRSLFESSEVGCASCHEAGRAFTDGQAHDIGTLHKEEAESIKRFHALTDLSQKGVTTALSGEATVPSFDTPSLRGVALTPPYLHDGSAPTLEAALLATSGDMGATAGLAPDDRKALIAYLETL